MPECLPLTGISKPLSWLLQCLSMSCTHVVLSTVTANKQSSLRVQHCSHIYLHVQTQIRDGPY